jgi:NADH-quinone oxidoreductase subunit M
MSSFFGFIAVGAASQLPAGTFSGVVLFWVTGGLTLAGWGLTVQALEARIGTVTAGQHRGLIAEAPMLGTFFLLFGLASVGFPGMCAFVGEEILLSHVVSHAPWVAVPVLLAISLNGITVVRWFFSLFYGEPTTAASESDLLPREKTAFMLLLITVVGLGVYPEPLLSLLARL